MAKKLVISALCVLLVFSLLGCPAAGTGGDDGNDEDNGTAAADDTGDGDGDGSGGTDSDSGSGGGNDSESGSNDGGSSVTDADDSGSDAGAISIEDVLSLFADGEALTGTSYDFGPVDPGGDGAEVEFTVENTTDTAYSLTTAQSDTSVFSLDAPGLPYSLEAGASVTVGVAFAPTDSGTESGVVTFGLEGVLDTLHLAVSGEGNEPPVARAIITVADAGESGANGTYYRSGTENTFDGAGDPPLGYSIPVYTREDGDYYIWGQSYTVNFGAAPVTLIAWVIDNDFEYDPDTGNGLYSNGYGFVPPSTTAPSPWNSLRDADTSEPNVISEFGEGIDGSVFEFQTLTATYEYSDPEGDAEGETSFAWYRGSSPTAEEADRVLITGADEVTYTAGSDDVGEHLFVRVTPAAASGTSPGIALWLGPSPAISGAEQ